MKFNRLLLETFLQRVLRSLLIFTSLLATSVFAQQTCKGFVENEWQDSRYQQIDNSGGVTITDLDTGLMWQQCTYGYSGNACISGSSINLNWQQALELPVSQNATGGYAGFNDWRLPSISELRTLAAFNCYSPAINLMAFPNTENKWFWTSSPFTYLDTYSWKINFVSGTENFYGRRTEYNSIRLVRSL